jgi:hypothetical protein
VTAVVTVADDGGSSGRLRRELGALPPGDLRMALAALAGDDDWGRTWAGVLQHRFGGTGALAGHPVGNLLLTGLAEELGEPVPALDMVARLVGAVGRVLPMSPQPLEIAAEVSGLDDADPGRGAPDPRPGRGGHHGRPGRVGCRWCRPRRRPARRRWPRSRRPTWSCSAPAPGSPACCRTCWCPTCSRRWSAPPARRVVALNLAAQPGETAGFSPQQHLEVLAAHAPRTAGGRRRGGHRRGDRRTWSDVGCVRARCRLVLAPVAAGDGTARHDPARLAAAYGTVLEELPAVVQQTAGGCPTGDGKRGYASGDDGVGEGRAQSRLSVTKTCDRRAEISALLRFAGGLHIVGGRVVVEAELDTGSTARRLRRDIAEVYGHASDVQVLAAPGCARATATSSGWSRTARAWPARPACSTSAAAGPGAAAAGGLGGRVRRGGGLAGRVPGARLADRAGPVVVAGDHLPGPEAALALVGAAAGWASRPRRARCAGSTGWWSATATRSARC